MKTVGLFLADQVNEYFQLVQSDAEQTGKKHGLNVVVQFADGRAATQTKQIHAAITAPEAARPIAIITAPVRDNSLNRLAQQAAGVGIGWIFLHRGIDSAALDSLRTEFPAVPVCLVTPDHNQIGRIQGRQILSLLPGGGNVVYIQGAAATSSARERLAAVLETTKGADVEIQVIDGNWTADDAERVLGGWLRIAMSGISKLNLVVCRAMRCLLGPGELWNPPPRILGVLRSPRFRSPAATGCPMLVANW